MQVETGDYSDKYGEGIVMSQSPNGGKLEKGGTVTITVSQGQDPEKNKVTVPSVTGMSQSQAINTLLSYNLAYALDTASAGSGTRERLPSKSITAGKKVDSGTVITIYVVPESSNPTGDNTNNSGNTPGTGSTTN